MKHGCTLLLAIALTNSSFAQNALTLRLDTTALNGIATYEGVPMTDGGNALLVVGDGELSLWKCDASGVAQWRNSYPSAVPNAGRDIAACDNGDVLLAYGGTMQGADPDTVTLALEVWRIASDGSVVWHHRYEQEPQFAQEPSYLEEISIIENGLSDLFVLHHVELGWQHRVAVTRLDATGSVIWSRRVGDQTASMAFPCSSNSCVGRINFYPDAQGGCRLTVPTGENFDESALFLSLTADGSLVWASNFDYLGNVNTCETFPPVVLEDGTTVLMTLSTSLNGGMHLIHISDSGTLLKVDRYDLNSNCCAGLAYDQGTLICRFYETVFTVNGSGGIVAASTSMGLLPDADNDYYLSSSSFQAHDGRVLLSSGFSAYPTGAGLPLASPALVSFALEGTPVCGRVPSSPVHDELPLSLFTNTPTSDMGAETIELNTVPLPTIPEPRPLLASIDLCVLTSITPTEEVPATFTVNRTLLNAGDVLTVSSSSPMNIVLRDAKGGLVWHSQRIGTRVDVSTATLTAGLYFVTASDATGHRMGTVKVAIER